MKLRSRPQACANAHEAEAASPARRRARVARGGGRSRRQEQSDDTEVDGDRIDGIEGNPDTLDDDGVEGNPDALFDEDDVVSYEDGSDNNNANNINNDGVADPPLAAANNNQNNNNNNIVHILAADGEHVDDEFLGILGTFGGGSNLFQFAPAFNPGAMFARPLTAPHKPSISQFGKLDLHYLMLFFLYCSHHMHTFSFLFCYLSQTTHGMVSPVLMVRSSRSEPSPCTKGVINLMRVECSLLISAINPIQTTIRMTIVSHHRGK